MKFQFIGLGLATALIVSVIADTSAAHSIHAISRNTALYVMHILLYYSVNKFISISRRDGMNVPKRFASATLRRRTTEDQGKDEEEIDENEEEADENEAEEEEEEADENEVEEEEEEADENEVEEDGKDWNTARRRGIDGPLSRRKEKDEEEEDEEEEDEEEKDEEEKDEEEKD